MSQNADLLDWPITRMAILSVLVVLALPMAKPILNTVVSEVTNMKNYKWAVIVIAVFGTLMIASTMVPESYFDVAPNSHAWKPLYLLRMLIRFIGRVETAIFGYPTIISIFPKILL